MQLLIHLLSLVLTLSVAATDAKICEVIHNKLTLLRYSNSTEISDGLVSKNNLFIFIQSKYIAMRRADR